MDSWCFARYIACRIDVFAKLRNIAIVAFVLTLMDFHPVIDKIVRLLANVILFILILCMAPIVALLLFLICGLFTVLLSWMFLFVLFISPLFIPTGVALLVASSIHVAVKMAGVFVSKISGLLHGPFLLQANYMVDSTPCCLPLLRLWRTCHRNGFLNTLASCSSRSALAITEESIFVLQHVANEPALFATVFKAALNLILTPVTLLVKIAILVIWPLIAAWSKMRSASSRLLSSTSYFSSNFCAVWKIVVFRPLACFSCLIFRIFRSVVTKVVALFLLPRLFWFWVASKIVSDEVLDMGSGEVMLEILRKVPVIRSIAVVQRTAAFGVRRANDTVERIIYVKDHSTRELYCRIRAASDVIHYYLDSYVDLPREVLFLLVRDYLVNGPMDRARRWMEDNLDLPYLLQESAGIAMNEMHPDVSNCPTSSTITTNKPQLGRSESEPSTSKSAQNDTSKSRRQSLPAFTGTIRGWEQGKYGGHLWARSCR